MVIIFLCELGIGIAGYIKHGQLEGILETGFNKTMAEYNENEHAWKLIQSEVRFQTGQFNSVHLDMIIFLFLDELLWYQWTKGLSTSFP